MNALTRRQFVKYSGLAFPVLATGLSQAANTVAKDGFCFPLLGDLHFDRLEHHDLEWLQREKPGDVRQVQNYSRLTAEMSPRLLARIKDTVAELGRNPATSVPFVLQVGDLIEGLCGTAELAQRQSREAVAFVEQAGLGAPFLFTKGNHDVTGPGATEAFRDVFHPFLANQIERVASPAPGLSGACFSFEHRGALFAFFDAYDARASLEWLEALAARRTTRHLFVVIHPPVVPYGARTTWHLFSGEKSRAHREHLLSLLGSQHAFVLTGHVHRYNCLVRQTARGRFLQLAVSSILNQAAPNPKNLLEGTAAYTPEQIQVEPGFSPETAPARRTVIEAEKPFVKAFEYADLPGYAVLKVAGEEVEAAIYPGTGGSAWRRLDLKRLLNG